MILHKLWLKEFRNFKDLFFERKTPNTPLLIYALNNQGKTNILSALYVSSHAKVPHSKLGIDSCIQEGANKAIVGLLYQKNHDETTQKLYTTLTQTGTHHQLNETVIKHKKKLFSAFPVLYLSADTLFSFISSPTSRRETLDSFCEQMDPEYHLRLKQYKKVIRQKNQALKQQSDVSLWNEQILHIAPILVQKRKHYLRIIQEKLNQLALHLFPDWFESISINYMAKYLLICDDSTLGCYKDSLYEQLKGQYEKERVLGYSRVGPHHDDVLIVLNQYPFLERYSRGIQRSIVLLFELSKLYLSFDEGQRPLLLLDDALCELDHCNKKVLLEVFKNDFSIIYATSDKKDCLLCDDFEVIGLCDGHLLDLSVEPVLK